MEIYNKIGDFFNYIFESVILQWHYDNGLIYFNGRDILVFIVGFLTCLVLVMFTYSFSKKAKRRIIMHSKKKKK